jgi:hypothetical protein
VAASHEIEFPLLALRRPDGESFDENSHAETSVSVTHAVGTTKTDTQSYSWEFHSEPNEHFIVEFWLDQVFGTLALRQQELAGKPRLRGIARAPLGNPLIGKPMTLTQAGKTYHTITDSHGQYAFQITVTGAPMNAWVTRGVALRCHRGTPPSRSLSP